jgi:putative FmdB family regulatory protein
MPTYEYRCPQGHVFEKHAQTMSGPKRARCPKCGKMGTRIISGGAGLVFKGTGFYITDYKRAGEKKESGEAKESKPEPKPDSKPKKDSTDK